MGGPAAAFTVAGLLIALSLPLLPTRRIRPLVASAAERTEPGTARQELLDGVRYIRRHRLIDPLVAAGAICELGLTGTLNVGMVLLNAERGWGPSGYGWIVREVDCNSRTRNPTVVRARCGSASRMSVL